MSDPVLYDGLMPLSVSNVETFDHNQNGGCQSRWWFERIEWMKPDKTFANEDGIAGHGLLAEFFTTGKLEKKRARMLKAVNGTILKGNLPKVGPDMRVEWRFDGQRQRTEAGEWIPLDVSKALWIAGVPWDGMIDLAYRRGDVPVVMDHKFSSDIHAYAKPNEGLIKTIQMPVYVMALQRLPEFADAKSWRIAHHYVSRKGVDSFIRSAIVTNDQVLERRADIESIIAQMKQVAKATKQTDVRFNRRSCDSWMGCPHQSICPAFKENKVALSQEEQELFPEEESSTPAAASAEDPFGDEPTPADDEVAALEAKLAAARAAKKAPGPIPDSKAAPPAAAPVPPAPKRTFIHPACGACGTDLNPDNASKLESGVFVHIGCPAKSAPVAPPPAPAAEAPRRGPGRPPKVKPEEAPGVFTPEKKAEAAIAYAETKAAGGTTDDAQSAARRALGIAPTWTPQRLARAFRAFADALDQP